MVSKLNISVKIGDLFKEKFKVGDKVVVVCNYSYEFKNKKCIGTIKRIDGAYIYVKPYYKRYELEVYASEIRRLSREEKIKLLLK